MSPRTRRLALLAFAVVLLLFAGRWVAVLYAERWWAAGISPAASHFVTDWAVLRLTLETTGVLLACTWFIGHLLLVYRAIGSVQVHRRLANLEIREAVNMQVLVWLSVTGGLILGFLAGRGVGGWTSQVVLSWSGAAYGEADPVLGRDLAFYLTRLPLWRLLHGYVVLLILLALGGAATLYVVIGAIRWEDRRLAMNDHARRHLGGLAVLLALALTWGYLLEPYELVAGLIGSVNNGLFEFRRGVAHLLAVVAMISGLITAWWAVRGRYAALLGVWGLLAACSLLGHHIIPALIGGEAGSLLDGATRRHLDQVAYGMTGIRDSSFARRDVPPQPPKPAALWGPTLAAEATASDSGRPVAIDRAIVTLQHRPRPAWIVVRDHDRRGATLTVLLDDQTSTTGLPLVYHEGDSLRTAAGVPSFRLPARGIWPGHRVAVLDSTGGGVRVGSGFRRLALAWALQSGDLLGPSVAGRRVFWQLDPSLRLTRLAPYAVWGAPMPRLIGGELVWLVDGYLPSASFPGSTRIRWRGHAVGSLRAAFIGVIGAESGATRIYLRHTADELAKQWQAIFDTLVQPASAMPAEVARALPYPAELLEAQARVLAQPHWRLGQPVGLSRQIGPAGPPETAVWDRDTTGVAYIVPYERNQERLISGLVQARVMDGWEALTIVRFDSLLALPAPALLQNRWTRFPTFQQLKDSVEKAGAHLEPSAVRYWPTSEALGAYQPWFAEREGQEPVAVWVSVAVGERRGAGHDLDEAWQNMLGLSAPIIDAAERGSQLLEVRRLIKAADAALKRGDLEAFGRAWDALKRALRSP